MNPSLSIWAIRSASTQISVAPSGTLLIGSLLCLWSFGQFDPTGEVTRDVPLDHRELLRLKADRVRFVGCFFFAFGCRRLPPVGGYGEGLGEDGGLLLLAEGDHVGRVDPGGAGGRSFTFGARAGVADAGHDHVAEHVVHAVVV